MLLKVQNYNFSGTITDSFSVGNSLRTVSLRGNGFEGAVVKSLVNCKNLEVLDL